MYEIVNKQVKSLTAFPSSQMNRTKLALAMSWRGNILSSNGLNNNQLICDTFMI